MYLIRTKTKNKETKTKVEFEKVAEDLLLVSVDYDVSDQSRVFSYWRLLGTGGNPPLEIGVNKKNKTIKSITAFIDNDCFENVNIERINILSGNISVDTEIFKKDNDYFDIEGKYLITLSTNNMICIFNENNNIKEAVGNNRISLFLNDNNELCGFNIYDLNEDEMEIIKSIQ